MAEPTSFSYRPGASLLHGLDVRCKLVSLAFISLSSLKANMSGLFLLTLVLIFVVIHIRIPFISVFKEMRYFLILLVFVFTARALSTPGTPVLENEVLIPFTLTRQGFYEGTLVCWRLLLIVLLGLGLVSTTRSSEIRAAVAWFFRPFPFIPGKRTATMIGLVMRFVPVILNQAREISDAQRARGIENRKNPVYRSVKLIIPLMRRTFEKADKLVIAMEARCYTENRTDPELSSGRKDWLALLLIICLCILIVEI
ncbi:energy-coupling factor transporter transmembrane component T [Desulfococcaceae bacterium HSG8]|nr:energy-coupling factor transporter transmembrane component T [Desulfococcaceae bacterium HSG8]